MCFVSCFYLLVGRRFSIHLILLKCVSVVKRLIHSREYMQGFSIRTDTQLVLFHLKRDEEPEQRIFNVIWDIWFLLMWVLTTRD